MSRPPTILAVDPGAVDTGIVVVRATYRPDLLAHTTVSREVRLNDAIAAAEGGLVHPDYLAAVTDGLNAVLDVLGTVPLDAVAIEDVVRPNPHKRRRDGSSVIDPGPVAATAATASTVVGWAAALDYPVVMVRPAGMGSEPLEGRYPPELLDRGGKALPNGKMRHARSAYDVALDAALEARVAMAG